ncbi:uncharacterized protein LOC127412695 isoform X2 [Myxocyprinus asiaticus]|uniref:uncharacterized protein LOC127412695 isoform X2 n=1 Tax=Myxocyprinus asiaticus TaxID=70543 RepID=UPI00222198CF|nr:uncharacterized protein LOC127412695 isoform X2 [Myxocyprinus asiaticus]
MTILKLDASDTLHEFIFVDEAGFNLTKRRQRGCNIIGQRTLVDVSGQHEGNVTLCAAISNHGLLHHHATLGPYNTQRLLTFLDGLWKALFQHVQRELQPCYVVVWDNVHFHHSVLVRNWFMNDPRFTNVFLTPYSPFLSSIEEFFSAWRWKVYDRNPYVQNNLLQAMEEACGDIAVESCQGCLRHSRAFFPRCLARENIVSNVDENLWPDPGR